MENYNEAKCIYENCKIYFPVLTGNAREWRMIDKNEILIETLGGHKFIFNNIRKTVRCITSKETDHQGDKEWCQIFSSRLMDCMYEHSITQKELADAIGVSQTVISKYANGLVIPKATHVTRMAKVFGCSSSDLID